MPRIIVRGLHGTQLERVPGREVILVGRNEGNDLVLQDPSVSRIHLSIHREGDGWVVEDRGSSNGTLLNGRRIARPEPLQAGDEIALGGTTLVFEPAGEGLPEEERGSTATPPSAPPDRTRLVGRSEAIRNLLTTISLLAESEAPVLLTGESGTGKRLVARLIHLRSLRSGGPFVVVGAEAFPDALLGEEPRAGKVPGTGAGEVTMEGLLPRGTIVLDEIGELSPQGQQEVLQLLEGKRVRKGNGQSVQVDARLLATTSRDLQTGIERGWFLADLYLRLAGLRLHIPPLRERTEDIPLLLAHFLSLHTGPCRGVHPDALGVLDRYHFPANVRELEEVVRRAQVLGKGPLLTPDDLPDEVLEVAGALEREPTLHLDQAERLYRRMIEGGESFWTVVKEPYLARKVSREAVERLIARLLEESGGSYKEVVRILRIEEDYGKFLRFLRRHDLGPP